MEEEGITINGFIYSTDLKTVLAADIEITSLSSMERGINTIGRCAFSGCRNLKVVRIPETVVRIEDFAFMDCVNIQELHLPRYIEYISPLAFISSENCFKSNFYYDIPNIIIPRETFFRYQFLMPYYIDEYDCSKYGVTMEEVEERDEYDFFKGLPSIITEQEFYRMCVALDLQFEGSFSSGKEICDFDSLSSIDEELSEMLFDACGFLDDHKLESTQGNVIFQKIDNTIDSLLYDHLHENFTSTQGLSPFSLMAKILQEAMFLGFSQPFIDVEFDDEVLFSDCYETGFHAFGHPIWGFYESVVSGDIDVRVWWEDMNIDYDKLLIDGISIYQEHGYMITPSFLRWIYRKLIQLVFHAGFTHGMNFRREFGPHIQ